MPTLQGDSEHLDMELEVYHRQESLYLEDSIFI